MKPPFEITPAVLDGVAAIERLLGRYEGLQQARATPMLRRSARVRSVQSSLAIEGNTLSEEQVTAIIEGKRCRGPARDVLEVQNALAAYDRLPDWVPERLDDLLAAHSQMMTGLVESAGRWRRGGVGIIKGSRIAHVAPPAKRVPNLMSDLLGFLKRDQRTHPAIKAAVFHYELEFIHPFDDGNGRVGRLWHTLILSRWHPLFMTVPIESVIRERQEDYYSVLSRCDKAGHSTEFVEFCLDATRAAMQTLLGEPRQLLTAEQRLELAEAHFGRRTFARRDYRELFPQLSSATASRDLQFGVANNRLLMTGDRRLAAYQFKKLRR